MQINHCVVLASRPQGVPTEGNFRVEQRPIPELQRGQILCRNRFISLDAGFRNWMDEGSGDAVLPAMPPKGEGWTDAGVEVTVAGPTGKTRAYSST